MLSNDLAGRNRYPGIDALRSVSRTIGNVTDFDHRARAPEPTPHAIIGRRTD